MGCVRAMILALTVGAIFEAPLAGSASLAFSATFETAHDAAFWRAIAANKRVPPTGSDVASLSNELVDLLASPDPELRDEIAYSTLASWIYQQKIVDAAIAARIVDRLLANLASRVGERDTDSVFQRSFSALTLSVVVARDNADPWLDRQAWQRIHAAALVYLEAEQDVRGYDPAAGWIHSAAHTADLLKFLLRSRYLDADGASRTLDAIGRKLTAAPVVFSFGEDERFARAILSLVSRADFDAAAFSAWLSGARPRLADRPTVADLRGNQNWKNALAKLEVLLSNEASPGDAAVSARSAVRAMLKTMF